MKIAFCIFKLFPYGGLQRNCLHTMQMCLAHGHEVHLFTREFNVDPIEGLHVHVIKVKAFSNHGKAKDFVEKIQSELKNFDRVVGFNRMPYLDVYFMGDVCYVEEAQKHGPWFRLTPRYKVYASFEKAVCDKNSKTKITVLTPHQKQSIQHYYKTPSDRITQLFPGIEKSRIPTGSDVRECLRNTFGLNDDDKLLLAVGSDFLRKGVDRAIVGFQSLPEELKQKTYLFVIGDDKPLQAHHPHIKFLGGRDDANEFYGAADVFLHPAKFEAGGMVLIEALVANLPVITTSNVGFAPYINDAKAGVVLRGEPFSQMDFNQALLDMLRCGTLKYKQSAEEYVKNHDLHRFTEQVVAIIEES